MKKVCPLLVMAIVNNSGGFDPEGIQGMRAPDKAQCMEKGCSWWVRDPDGEDDAGDCAVEELAWYLRFLAIHGGK